MPPFHKNIARAIQKAPKFYFYDTGQVIGDSGIKLENTVAWSLQKEIHFREDCFEVFNHIFPQVKMTQVTKELKREKTFPNGAEIRIAHNWLSELRLP